MSKEVIGLIGPLEGKGKGRVTRRFALVFAKNELIVVKIGGTLSVLSPLLGEVGYGLSTITDVYNHFANKRVDRLKKMQIQDILDLDNLNFSVPYSDIENIEVKKKSVLSPRGRRIIDIAAKSRKYWFRLVDEKAFNYCVNLVEKIRPNKA